MPGQTTTVSKLSTAILALVGLSFISGLVSAQATCQNGDYYGNFNEEVNTNGKTPTFVTGTIAIDTSLYWSSHNGAMSYHFSIIRTTAQSRPIACSAVLLALLADGCKRDISSPVTAVSNL